MRQMSDLNNNKKNQYANIFLGWEENKIFSLPLQKKKKRKGEKKIEKKWKDDADYAILV